jgi:hypothetical protein
MSKEQMFRDLQKESPAESPERGDISMASPIGQANMWEHGF